MEIETTIIIERPVEDVFNFIAVRFAEHLHQLSGKMISKVEQLSENSTGLGAKFRLLEPDAVFELSSRRPFIQVGQRDPEVVRQLATVVEVVEYQPYEKFSYSKTEEGYSYITIYTLWSLNGATELTAIGKIEPKSSGQKLWLYATRGLGNWIGRKHLEQLKTLIEEK